MPLPSFRFGERVDALECAFFLGSLLHGTTLAFKLRHQGELDEPIRGVVAAWESDVNEAFIIVDREGDESVELPLSIIKEVIYL